MSVPIPESGLYVETTIANGLTAAFPFNFMVLDEEDVAVYVDSVAVVSGYTVEGIGEATGQIVFEVLPEDGAIVTMLLWPRFFRESNFNDFGDFTAANANREFDRAWIALQSLLQSSLRSIKLPIDTTTDQVIEPAPGTYLGFDTEGNIVTKVGLVTTEGTGVSAFDDIPALRLNSETPTRIHAYVGGGADLGDGDGGMYWYDAADTASVDDGVFVIVDAVGSRWKRMPTPIISTDLELNVPGDHDTLRDAFEYLEGQLFSPSVTIFITVDDGTHDYSTGGSVRLNHPLGRQISITGNEVTPTNCALDFGDADYSAITVTDGCCIGYLNGFHVKHNSQKISVHGDNWDTNSTGILANDAARIIMGEQMVVSDFFYGIAARQNSHVECQYALVYNAGDVGIWCYMGSFIDCSYAEMHHCRNADNGFGSGATAEYTGTIMATGIHSHDNNFNGITSRSNSVIRAKLGSIHDNAAAGAFASDTGMIQIGGTNIYGNGTWGIRAINNAYIAETGEATFIGAPNVLGNIMNNVMTDPRTDGAAQLITLENGPLYIVAKGGNDIFMNTAADQTQLKIEHQAAAVNAVTVKGSMTGGAVKVYPTGTDTNIDLDLAGKGTGVVRIGAHTANVDALVTGYITVKDSAGNLRKLAVIA